MRQGIIIDLISGIGCHHTDFETKCLQTYPAAENQMINKLSKSIVC